MELVGSAEGATAEEDNEAVTVAVFTAFISQARF